MSDIVKFWSSHKFLHLNKHKKSTNSSVGNGGCIHDVYYMWELLHVFTLYRPATYTAFDFDDNYYDEGVPLAA
jgi:hypothetical protein